MSLIDRFKALDPVIVGLTAGLLVFGLVMLMSATGPIGVSRTGDGFYYVKHQLLVGVLPGCILFALMAVIPARIWRALAMPSLVLTFILLLSVFLPGIGVERGGAHGWLQAGPLSFQPSELAKLTFLVYVAAFLAGRKEGEDPKENVLPFLLTLGAVMLLLILEPDTGSMAVVAGMSIILFLLSGAPLSWFAGLVAVGIGLVALLVKLSPYRAARFMTFLHPELDPQGIGYHINQAILAIGSGGFWGLGYGHSRQKFLYLPEVEADSISAVIAEEMGFWVMVVLIALFACLVWRCFKIAKNAGNTFEGYLAAGIGSWIAIQVVMNLASMAGMMPMTGVTLPFISHGGSSLTVLLGAMGLVASLPSQEHAQRLRA